MEATMSAKAIAILSAAIVLFASNAVSQDPTIVKSQLGFRIPEIESFYVERGPHSDETVFVLGESENFVLTDIWMMIESPGSVDMSIYRNSKRHMIVIWENWPEGYSEHFQSGLAYHPGDTLWVHNGSDGRFYTTLSGYFFNE
jgi:hypothetical protein